jgi:regulator of replication initiation timing
MTPIYKRLKALEELANSPYSSEEDLRRQVPEIVETLRRLHDEMQRRVVKILEENESLRKENRALRESLTILERQREALLEQTHRAHPGHDYQRQMWFFGWLEKDPKRIKTKTKDGEIREKTYDYWYFHWMEGGKHRSRYIGKDEQLETWKADYGDEGALRAWARIQR